MNRRRLIAGAIMLGTLGLAGGAVAQEPIPFGEGLYWRIDRKGAPPSYVLGTIHFGAPCEVNLGSEVARRIGLSRVVFLELRLDQTTMQSLQHSMFLPAGQSLPALIGYDTFKMITPYAHARGITTDVLARLKPWVVWQIMAPYDAASGARPTESIDRLVYDRARVVGREVKPLEAIQEQIRVLESQPATNYASSMTAVIRHQQARTGDAAASQLLALYRAEQIAPLLALMESRARENDDRVAQQELRSLSARNSTMVARAMNELRQGAAFLAVGALHLPGEFGVLRRLEQLGFTVTRESQGPMVMLPEACGRPALRR
jgi:uncharacterized protein